VTFVRKPWIGSVLAGIVAAVALVYAAWSVLTHWPATRAAPSGAAVPSPDQVLRYIAPGVRLPQIDSPNNAAIDADDEVIGIVVNGRARAYRLEAMEYIRSHVLNDVIDGQPVTVTYCDITDCVLVVTDDDRAEPLDIDIGGTSAGLFLFLDGEGYDQRTGLSARNHEPFPLDALPFARTTWEDWHDAYPDSGVYVGQ
jgi:hypothetical protein